MLKLLVDTYEEPEQTDTEQIVDIWFGDLVWFGFSLSYMKYITG